MVIEIKGKKKCPKCNRSLDISFFYKNKTTKLGLDCYCKECKIKICSQYSYKHKQKDYSNLFYSKNKERIKKESRDRWVQDRLECLKRYSGEIPFCFCCKEDIYEFLALDHIDGGGNKHRKEIGGKLVRWLKKNNYPSGYRVLYHNCNHSLGVHGYCPHQK